MRYAAVFNQTMGTEVSARVELATSMWARFWGLMGRRSLESGSGVLLRPSSSVHMFFMRFPIDVIFLDRDGVVVKVVRGLKPWRLAFGGKGAHSALELPAGTSEGRLAVGDRVEVRPDD